MNALDLRMRRPLKTPGENAWPEWTSEAKVIEMMISGSGFKDKTIAIEIGIDAATLSKAQSGQARLSESHMDALMDAVGSEAWLFYWLLKRNYDPRSLRQMETELERENRELREKVEKMQNEREVERAFMRDIRMTA